MAFHVKNWPVQLTVSPKIGTIWDVQKEPEKGQPLDEFLAQFRKAA
jgi:hypothetical protein